MSEKHFSHEIQDLTQGFDDLGYVLEEDLATALFLVLELNKPLLLEGFPGVGKTEIAYTLAEYLDTQLIRLQCYEGLDVNAAVYEWNYQKQLLSIKIMEKSGLQVEEVEHHIFSREFLLERPLLKAITHPEKPAVLLIDEIDRADEEFEAFLLELLSAFQISIPELGTIKARHKPFVILTSNRTRELGDALKRRCLYHWIGYPSLEKEKAIVQKRLPNIETGLAETLVALVQKLRRLKLSKAPGISETLDWANALTRMGHKTLDAQAVDQSLGCVLKSADDLELVRSGGMDKLLTD